MRFAPWMEKDKQSAVNWEIADEQWVSLLGIPRQYCSFDLFLEFSSPFGKVTEVKEVIGGQEKSPIVHVILGQCELSRISYILPLPFNGRRIPVRVMVDLARVNFHIEAPEIKEYASKLRGDSPIQRVRSFAEVVSNPSDKPNCNELGRGPHPVVDIERDSQVTLDVEQGLDIESNVVGSVPHVSETHALNLVVSDSGFDREQQ